MVQVKHSSQMTETTSIFTCYSFFIIFGRTIPGLND